MQADTDMKHVRVFSLRIQPCYAKAPGHELTSLRLDDCIYSEIIRVALKR